MVVTGEALRTLVSRIVERKGYALAVLCLLCMVVYGRTLDVPFMFDDYGYVADNPLIRNIGTLFDQGAIEGAETHEDVKNNLHTRPLSYFTFALNYHLHQTSVQGYHLVNIAIHLIAAGLVYALVLLTAALCQAGPGGTGPPGEQDGTALRVAFFTAALFVVHPVLTNAVTYITQRMASLATLFYLLAIALYARSRLSGGKAARMVCYVAALVSCVAAMGSKEIAFTLPLVLVIYDRIFCRDQLQRSLVRLAPFLATMLLIPLALLDLKSSATGMRSGSLSTMINLVNYANTSPLDYLLTQVRVLVTYLRMLLVPTGLTLAHDDLQLVRSLPVIALSLLLHLVLVVAALLLLRRSSRVRDGRERFLRRLAAFGIIWFYLTLATVSSIIPMNDLMYEHRMYLPAFGFLVALVASLYLLREKFAGQARLPLPAGAVLLGMVAVFTLLALARNEQWRDPVAFWQDAAVRAPGSYYAHIWLADSYQRAGDLDGAIREYNAWLDTDPADAEIWFLLGNVCFRKGAYRDAVNAYLKSVALEPYYYGVYYEISRAYDLLGEREMAQEARQKGQDVEASNNNHGE